MPRIRLWLSTCRTLTSCTPHLLILPAQRNADATRSERERSVLQLTAQVSTLSLLEKTCDMCGTLTQVCERSVARAWDDLAAVLRVPKGVS